MNSEPKVYTFSNLVEAAQAKNFGEAVTINERQVAAFRSHNAPGEFENKTYEQIADEANTFANRLTKVFM
ncbi:MAG: hypothetical protein IPP76_02715 [Moraxellaceae bacterium]|nr:hypothetical protein [Moraxellaceae bacterium]MBL0229749.1 hypothetical protein [Moraxellaceae bacterium]